MFTTPEPFNTAGYDENQEKTYLNLTTDLENLVEEYKLSQ
jgi:hypothetical protein